jgi:hypothetical protein
MKPVIVGWLSVNEYVHVYEHEHAKIDMAENEKMKMPASQPNQGCLQ